MLIQGDRKVVGKHWGLGWVGGVRQKGWGQKLRPGGKGWVGGVRQKGCGQKLRPGRVPMLIRGDRRVVGKHWGLGIKTEGVGAGGVRQKGYG